MLYFITGNVNKWRETKPYLPDFINLMHLPLDLQEIQSADNEAIVSHKLDQAYQQVHAPVLCEDTALYIKEINGFPGVYVKYFLMQVGLPKIAQMTAGSAAVAHTCYGYWDGKEKRFFHGKVNGRIASTPKGEGFGFDPIFIPEGHELTYAQLPKIKKESCSHRALALQQVGAFLQQKKHAVDLR